MTFLRNKPHLSLFTNPNNTIPFPALTLELRHKIYTHIIFPNPQRTPHHSITISAADAIHASDPSYPYFLPKLCRVNEATRIEVGLFFIHNTEFSILYPQHVIYFAQFLDTFPANAGFGAIRRLDFQLFSRHRPDSEARNTYIELMRKCPGLTEICMKVEVWYLLKQRLTHSFRVQLTPEELGHHAREVLDLERLVAAYKLEGVLELKNLNRLTIEFWPKVHAFTTKGMRTEVSNAWPVMEVFTEWLRRGFEQNGRRAEVRLVQSANAG